MRRPILRWFGGKFRLAKWIISHIPEHRIYVEPYGGAASVLMQKPRSYAEIYNDLDNGVFNLFQVLRDEHLAEKLRIQLAHTPFSRHEFSLAHGYHPDPVENARRLVVRSFMGFGADSASASQNKTGFRSNSNRSGSTPAHDWVNYWPEVDNFRARLAGVVIENRDAREVMAAHDGPETLHYVDPPYWPDSRRAGSYKHDITNAESVGLLDFLKTLKGKVVLSGYNEGPYKDITWRSVKREARADKAGLRIEYLWFNFEDEKHDIFT
jgi:DNA adenine methylase